MTNLFKVDYKSPIGVIEIAGSTDAIHSILFTNQKSIVHEAQTNSPEVIRTCYQEIDEYFTEKRKEFTFPYSMEGTTFQKDVWHALTNIPYAHTVSYKDIAHSIGNEKAIRAVGNANGKNKLNIVIPCHRVIGTNGKLTGYGGGLWRKEWLLEHEQRIGKM
ncbi:methylated-DNA--[protein]-cysteine S-methyltransferase [Virgibacillus dakarensis]|nr:methylated-DNA--[protein]-cysteine S-methyltransferase [Virgibacillus dakarensis]